MADLWFVFSLGIVAGVLLMIGFVALGVAMSPRDEKPTYRPNVRWIR